MNQEVINAIVEKGMQLGINFVDTAPWYGQGESEKRLGIALKDLPRKSFYIATKVKLNGLQKCVHYYLRYIEYYYVILGW